MQLDVLWLPAELDRLADPPGLAIVVDVIRATTSISTALAAGAERVRAVASLEEARRIASREGALLCGERNGRPPAGFDLGNSPRDFTPAAVRGRALVFTTSNGTAAMERAAARVPVWLGCFRNGAAVAAALAAAPAFVDGPVVILCAGRRGRISMDDAWCAGHLVQRIERMAPRLELEDGARAARDLAGELGRPAPEGLALTRAGRALDAIGLAADLASCAAVDDLDVVPVLREGAFVQGGEEAADVG